MRSIVKSIYNHSIAHPGKTAIIAPDITVNYEMFWRMIQGAASRLKEMEVKEGDRIENNVEALTERRRQIDSRRKTLLIIMCVVIVLSALPIIPRIVRWSIASIVGVATIVAETTSLGRDRWERFDKAAGIALQAPFVCLALAMSTIRYEEKMSAACAGLFGLAIIGVLAAIIIETLRDKAADRINELKADAEKRIKALYRA